MSLLKHSKKFFFQLDPHPIWNKKSRSLRISGWCIAKNKTRLTAVRARLPEIFETRFDRERPEVAKYLRGEQALAPCGFVLDIKVPKGRARLAFDAADASGTWQQIFFTTIRNGIIEGANDPERWSDLNASLYYDFAFEHPVDWNKPRRMLYVTGWCVDRAAMPIQSMRARVGSKKTPVDFGLARPDVAALFPENSQAEHSGFSLALPPSPKPSHLEFEARSKEGPWRRLASQLIPGRSRTARPDELFAPPDVAFIDPHTNRRSRYRYWLDEPFDWSKSVRYLRVAGWCLTSSGEPVTEVRARIRGKHFPARYGIRRPDVGRALNNFPAALCSGFSLNAVVPPGPATFILEARSADGEWETFFEQRVKGPFFREQSDLAGEMFGDYAMWIKKYDRLTRRDRQLIRRHIAQFAQRPLISVLMPTYNSNLKWLRRAIESVRQQLYPHWELCIADDASTNTDLWPELEALAQRDQRIKIIRRSENGGIAAASNNALALASGAYVALLDHDDELAPSALYFIALELNRDPQAQLIYSDEDKIDGFGRRFDPHFKPDWSRELFLSQNYLSHLSVYNTQLVRKIGGFREGFEGAQDYDLTLRCLEQIEPSQIRHIPYVLYHWRADDNSTAGLAEAKPYAQQSALRAVQEYLDRAGVAASVVPHRSIYQRVKYKLPSNPPRVSIIIPTRDRQALLEKCVQSILAQTDYPNYKLIILDNESAETETQEYLDSLGTDNRLTVHRVDGPFNYSKLNNEGVAHARGDFVALLNNDLEVIDSAWLSEMVSQASQPGVGAVGARLRYPDGPIQHGGVIIGAGGIAGHAHGTIRDQDGYFCRPHLTQNLSAVTAACILIKKDIYLQLGGFDEMNLPVAFNDVDFCLRLRQAGFEIVWTPHAELYHHESASRGYEDTVEKQTRFLTEIEYMRGKWSEILPADPFYNPNLSLGERLFMPAFPPRVNKPWLDI